MAQFKPDTGWSIFDIYLDGYGEPAGFTVSYGSRDTLLNISVSNAGQILDMGLIYADRIRQENTVLPDLSRVRQYQFPQGPSWEDQMFRKPMWINLHPEKRELEMICLPAPLYQYPGAILLPGGPGGDLLLRLCLLRRGSGVAGDRVPPGAVQGRGLNGRRVCLSEALRLTRGKEKPHE